MAIEKSSGAVVYRVTEEGTDLYLLLQASPGKPWGFPKGKIDAGESEEAAAYREIAEEAGLRNLTFDPDFRYVVHYIFHRGRTIVRKEVVYFLARADTAEVNISWEHVAFRWVTLEKAMDMVGYENAREALRRAEEYLAKRRQ